MEQRRSAIVKHIIKCFSCLPLSLTMSIVLSLSRQWSILGARHLSTRSTQPGHPFVGKRNEYQPKGGDALRLGSKGRCGSCMGGR